MKRFILLVMLTLFCMAGHSQIYQFKTLEFSHKAVYNGMWSNWAQWKSVNILIEMDLSKDLITIYSKETQRYKVLETGDTFQDGTGEQTSFSIVDHEFDVGTLRLRRQNNGAFQIYIDFANIAWVYNIKQIN